MSTNLHVTFLACLIASLALAACNAEASPNPATNSGAEVEGGANQDRKPVAVPAPKAAEPAVPARTPMFDFAPGGTISDADLTNYHVLMNCAVDGQDVGTLTFDLWGDRAPITVRNFLRLCDEGFYDGITFHRIVRNFMVQGGDPTGTGTGNSPYGNIQAEFSTEPDRAHGYGVLSMARFGQDPNSASSQFFLCCDESPSVWGLDGKYSSFGRLTSGVVTLEALADAETIPDGRENSKPAKPVTITRAEVKSGPAPKSEETIARPELVIDLGGAPEKVVVQHILIAFKGAMRAKATRTKEEAKALAQGLLQKAKDGEEFMALVRANSDDSVVEGDPQPGVYRVLNAGVRNKASERAAFEVQSQFEADIAALQAKQQAGELTPQEFQVRGTELQTAAMARLRAVQWMNREKMAPSFGDVSFSLGVGEVGLAPHDAAKSPFGWHIIKRLE